MAEMYREEVMRLFFNGAPGANDWQTNANGTEGNFSMFSTVSVHQYTNDMNDLFMVFLKFSVHSPPLCPIQCPEVA